MFYPEMKQAAVVLIKVLFLRDDLLEDLILERQRADRRQKPAVSCSEKQVTRKSDETAYIRNGGLTQNSLTKVKPGEPFQDEGRVLSNFLQEAKSHQISI